MKRRKKAKSVTNYVRVKGTLKYWLCTERQSTVRVCIWLRPAENSANRFDAILV